MTALVTKEDIEAYFYAPLLATGISTGQLLQQVTETLEALLDVKYRANKYATSV